MAQISISKTDRGAAIRFPFELKDAFRASFKTAKWNARDKKWEVGPRSVKRLEQWVAEVEASGVIEDLTARDERDFLGEELDELRRKIESVKLEIRAAERSRDDADADAARERAVETRAKLDEMKSALGAAAAARDEAIAAAAAARADVWSIVSRHADIDEIESLRRGMLYDWREPKAVNSLRFRERQDRLREIRDELIEVGIKSRALGLAASANFNRRDRDRDNLFVPIEFEVVERECA
jgi:hypothetical protein